MEPDESCSPGNSNKRPHTVSDGVEEEPELGSINKRSKVIDENNKIMTSEANKTSEVDEGSEESEERNYSTEEPTNTSNECDIPAERLDEDVDEAKASPYIKTEPDDSEAAAVIKREDNEGEAATSSGEVPIVGEVVRVKIEQLDDELDVDNSNNIRPQSIRVPTASSVIPAVKVEKVEAVSSTRESCKFGIRCYRRNPIHRQEMAHYGDPDYRMPDYPTPPLGTPDCPFGKRCYRRNPDHFAKCAHPPETDFAKNYRMRLRKRKAQQQQQNGTVSSNAGDDDSDLDDYDLSDPFIDDSGSEYEPGDEDDEDDDDVDNGGGGMKQPAFFFTNNSTSPSKVS